MIALLLACVGAPPEGPGTDTAPDTDTIDPAFRDGLTEGGVVRCPNPVAREAEPFHGHNLESWEKGPKPFGGLAVADFDGNGVLDIYLPGPEGGALQLGLGDGTFVDVSAGRLPTEPGSGWGASGADVDGDGDVDLYIARSNQPDSLFENDGAGFFTDISAEAGLSEDEGSTRGVSWADFDGDGDLDGIVAGYSRGGSEDDPEDPSRNILLLNDGSGGFADVTEALLPLEVSAPGFTYIAGWHDLDLDGWPELYVVNDFGDSVEPNRLYVNAGPEGGGALGLIEGTNADIAARGMGLGVGDVNGDGLPDLLVSSLSAVPALLSAGPLSYYDAAFSLGLLPQTEQVYAWGAELVDIDNDADLDALVGFGQLLVQKDTAPEIQPDALWLREGDGFIDAAPAWGVDDPGYNRGLVVADLNDDGWLDIVKRDLNGPTRVYLAACGAESWLKVRLRGSGRNTAAVGARVEITTGDGTQQRSVQIGGTSLGSTAPAELHFGLGSADRISRVTVNWPGGEVSRYAELDARQSIIIDEAQASGAGSQRSE